MDSLINYQIELAKTQIKALRMKAQLYKKSHVPSPWAAAIETDITKAKFSIISMKKELKQWTKQ